MRQWLRNPYAWAFVVGCALMTLMRPLLRRVPPPPPVLRQVPAFSLVAADGRPFGSEELRGHVYVASFFFTRCPSVCPTLMKGMATLQHRFRDEALDTIRLVSISVDPDYDTPERLRAALPAYGVDSSRWVLLTGPRDRVRALAVEGFQVALGEPQSADGGVLDIAHAARLLLVDGNGALRGIYDSDALGLDEVFWRSRRLVDESRGR
ncbi:MAG: SCO family protein [Candidatus Binatia bacterium]|jgi:protein SCO1